MIALVRQIDAELSNPIWAQVRARPAPVGAARRPATAT